ncbi:MAG TPA: hypothetical protein VE954_18410 [Oligoflexus sp.]|uniref:hypothetical protein n=1 Tax=Oligoflexus sp. TaxID=1971216 RepID=UPI002D384737|nr:hypothetical protein [Oligoflexus sp.]HYX35075.1 hypothetical protein [Oligoflexus sp.]
MKIRAIILVTCLAAWQNVLAAPADSSISAILTSKNAQLQKSYQDLESRVKSLEAALDRLKQVELAANSAKDAAAVAQTSANNAQASANNAQATANIAHHSYTNVSYAGLRSFHEGCVPNDSAGPNCMAAAHRYCGSLGFAAGLVQEVGSDAYAVACFR